jgi:serine/threonine-protein kinase
MADIYVAYDEVLDRRVAVKVLAPHRAADKRFVHRFHREAKAVAHLNDPNIVQVYDWGSDHGTYYIAMELVDGESLADLLRRHRPLDPQHALHIAIGVTRALGVAHRNGIIHRDVKPGNILLTRTGEVKVTDFGIAHDVRDRVDLTETGNVMGTATYLSPEQAQGFEIGPRSDLYSLGVVLFEMVTGSVPFTGPSPYEVARKHVLDPAPRAATVNPELPPSLASIIDQLLAKTPEHRYPAARELEHALIRLYQTVPSRRARAIAPVEATQAMPAAQLQSQPLRAEPDTYYEAPSRSGVFIAMLAVVLLAAVAGLFALSGRIAGIDDSAAESDIEVPVPSVIGDHEATATNRLEDAGFEVVARYEESDTADVGVVIAQDPTGGTQLNQGSIVTIVVAVSNESVRVPPVVGKVATIAQNELAALGFTVVIDYEASDTIDVDRVIGQSVEPGEDVNRGQAITLTVSSGPQARSTSTTAATATTTASTTTSPASTPSSTQPKPSTTTSATSTTQQQPQPTTTATQAPSTTTG